MKKMLLAVVAVLMMLLLGGCETIEYGTVTDKSYSPAHMVYIPITIYSGKSIRQIPNWHHYPDSWKIRLQNEEDSGWIDVSKDFYDTVDIGDEVDMREEKER